MDIYRIEPGPLGSKHGFAHLRRLAGGYVCNVEPCEPTDVIALAAEKVPTRRVGYVHVIEREGCLPPIYMREETTGRSFWSIAVPCERCGADCQVGDCEDPAELP